MKKITIFCFIFSVLLSAQVPSPAFNPMTAPGAKGIVSGHVLYWQNPSNIQYNECYFSSDSLLVANLDVSVRIQNGYPSTVNESVIVSSILENTKYFWRVVEYNTSGNAPSPLWYFHSQPPAIFYTEFSFESDFDGWQIFGPYGFDNWYWSNTSSAGGIPGEAVFRWDPVFVGDSYLISPETPCPAGTNVIIDFRFYEDWWSNTVVVGCATTTDNGNEWNSIWELQATGNVGPEYVITNISAEGNFRLGFYYTGDSNDIDFLFVDDVTVYTAMESAYPPSLLQASASSTEQIVNLNWNSGVPFPPPIGYRIQRKDGLPLDNSPYTTLTETNYNTHNFIDESVELNHNYTYRIAMISGGGNVSHFGNEATAYVPAIVPVELQSFTAEVIESNIKLLWSTATETNNQGFEIERSASNGKWKMEDGKWEKIGFVPGFGTTTEVHHYSFIDEALQSGSYQYRLKQIDFDGSFEYSNIVAVTIDAPTKFSLEYNYPNPFNPTTKIKFEIPGQARNDNTIVTLKIYDVLGNEVVTLVNEEKPGGTYEVEFDATELPSGIYFYQLKAGSFIDTKKMILIK